MSKKREIVMDYWKAPKSDELMIGFFTDGGLDKAFKADNWRQIFLHALYLGNIGYEVKMTGTVKVEMDKVLSQKKGAQQ